MLVNRWRAEGLNTERIEAPLIPELISQRRQRVRTMLEVDERPVKPAPQNAYLDSLRRLNEEQSGDSESTPA